MKLHNLIATKKGKTKKIWKLKEKSTVWRFPNLLSGLQITKTNQVLVTDITDISISSHKLGAFLYTFRDPFTGMILGYSYAHHQRTELVHKVFNNVIKSNPGIHLNNIIIHSDNGLQFLSAKFQSYINKFKIKWSNYRTYNSTDNAFAETWFSSMKTELFRQKKWENYQELFWELNNYIKWYNNERIMIRFKMDPKEFMEKNLTI